MGELNTTMDELQDMADFKNFGKSDNTIEVEVERIVEKFGVVMNSDSKESLKYELMYLYHLGERDGLIKGYGIVSPVKKEEVA